MPQASKKTSTKKSTVSKSKKPSTKKSTASKSKKPAAKKPATKKSTAKTHRRSTQTAGGEAIPLFVYFDFTFSNRKYTFTLPVTYNNNDGTLNDFVSFISSYINVPITNFNKANGTQFNILHLSFTNAHSAMKLKDLLSATGGGMSGITIKTINPAIILKLLELQYKNRNMMRNTFGSKPIFCDPVDASRPRFGTGRPGAAVLPHLTTHGTAARGPASGATAPASIPRSGSGTGRPEAAGRRTKDICRHDNTGCRVYARYISGRATSNDNNHMKNLRHPKMDERLQDAKRMGKDSDSLCRWGFKCKTLQQYIMNVPHDKIDIGHLRQFKHVQRS